MVLLILHAMEKLVPRNTILKIYLNFDAHDLRQKKVQWSICNYQQLSSYSNNQWRQHRFSYSHIQRSSATSLGSLGSYSQFVMRGKTKQRIG